MDNKMEKHLDWPKLEGIEYADEPHPEEVLAPVVTEDGVLITAFFPFADKVKCVRTGKGREYTMMRVSESGIYAVLVPLKKTFAHYFVVDGVITGDPYSVKIPDDKAFFRQFETGCATRANRKMGAHKHVIDDVKGTMFRVWAPGALRVSVVGDFCKWDGRCYTMIPASSEGVFELFIPYLTAPFAYAFEIKLKNGVVYRRPDPYGSAYARLGDEPVNCKYGISHRWTDREFLKAREEGGQTDRMVTLSVDLPSFAHSIKEGGAEKVTYREIAREILSLREKYDFTHVELSPVSEYPDDDSRGYATGGFFAPTGRYGTPADFKALVDMLHAAGLYVILTVSVSAFSPDERFMASFDGTHLYDHLDPRIGLHPVWKTCLFRYSEPRVRSFLLSFLSCWIREYHADGFRFDSLSTTLSNAFGRDPRAVVYNCLGNTDNLDGIDFLRQMTSFIRKEYPGVVLIADEDMGWGGMTGTDYDHQELGFHLKWNRPFMKDMLYFASLDEEGRRIALPSLTHSMLLNRVERGVLSLTFGDPETDALKEGMNGSREEKEAMLRMLTGLMMCQPGKKRLSLAETENAFAESLLKLCGSYEELFACDDEEGGFEWLGDGDEGSLALAFARKANDKERFLVVVANASDSPSERLSVSVPAGGHYKEIFNSDDVSFGGSGMTNPRARTAKEISRDDKEYRLTVRLAPRSISVLERRT